MRQNIFLLLLILLSQPAWSQKVLQIERYGQPRAKKLFIGDQLTYKIRGDEVWHSGYIDDLLVERNVIAFDDRYVSLGDIEALRKYNYWTKPVSISMYTFGVAWSGFSLIGTATDGNPDTNYRPSDAIVTATAVGLGFLIHQLFHRKTLRLDKKRRLRLLDLSFKAPD